MNFQNILNLIQEQDPEVYEKLSPRRQVLKSFGSKVAVAALPFAIGSLFKKAYGKNTTVVSDALSFALTLEHLEDAFYKKILSKPNLIPKANYIDALKKISKHETAHIAFLQNALQSLGASVPPPPMIDLTGGGGSGNGSFKPLFDNFANFIGMAQAFEDLGVRAYKGQATNLMGYPDIMKAALGIHSMEARHAARIRHMRFEAMIEDDIRPWIKGNQSQLDDIFYENVYAKDENTLQANINIINLNGQNISFEAATEAFDEPLKQDEVLKIASTFIYG